MAKTLSEQVSAWPPFEATQDKFADNGSALHSAFMFDMPRALNNLGTYCEPTMQFLFNSGEFVTPVAPSQRYVRTTLAMPAAGLAFLGQAPILVPHQAARLFWTLSLVRGNFGPDPPGIQITAVHLFLGSMPVTGQSTFVDNFPVGTTGHEHETVLTTTEAALSQPAFRTSYFGHSFAAAFSGSNTDLFVADTTTGWQGFMTGAIMLTAGVPLTWLVVCVDFVTANVLDVIIAKEFTIWGVYE